MDDAARPARRALSAQGSSGYGRGARVLGAGIASTGLFTFAYFAVADQVLDDTAYGAISLLWSVLFVGLSVLYRPVEQLLSRSIADRRARGTTGGHPLRTPVLLQAGFAASFLVLALALRGPLVDGFGGSEALWGVFAGAAVAYAASYFARGYFAGHGWFGLYGGLVLFESIGRFCFPLAVAVGIAGGQTAVALGILAAPLLSLLVVPAALARHARSGDTEPVPAAESPSLRTAGGFAGAVALIQLAEQALVNAAVLVVAATASTALAGVVFNALLITRAPLQLFQAVQTSLLPHLAGAAAGDDRAEFARAVRVTVLAIAGFAGLVSLGLLAVGPLFMELVFAKEDVYGRVGLALIGLGMGFHLAAGTLNQALLARGRGGVAAACWLVCAAGFVAWMLLGLVQDELLRTEVGYLGAAAALCALLGAAVRRRP